MKARAESHPFLSQEYKLSADQIQSFRRDGHILLRGVAPKEEIELLRPAIIQAMEPVVRGKDRQGRLDDYSSLFTQVTNVWRMSEVVRRFIFAQRFARIAAELMGVDGVRLYHDQVLFKPPGGRPTPWHVDHYYWPLETEHTITMWMPLVDLRREMGSMVFASGSHKLGKITERPISEESQEFFERLISQNGFRRVSYELKAGDATFHSGRVLHSAHANNSSTTREVITIIYYADGTRLLAPDNEHRKVDMEVFHPGQKPGEIAASELNPVLWP